MFQSKVDFERRPITWADLILVFPLVVTEIVAAVSPDETAADQALVDVGTRLLSAANNIENERSGVLVRALATQLIATEWPKA